MEKASKRSRNQTEVSLRYNRIISKKCMLVPATYYPKLLKLSSMSTKFIEEIDVPTLKNKLMLTDDQIHEGPLLNGSGHL